MRYCCFLILTITICLSSFAQEKPAVALLDLDCPELKPGEARTLTDKLGSKIVQSGKFTVIERGKMESILKEQGFQQSGCTSQACAVEAGQLLGVQYMLAGSIGKVGSIFLITLRLIDVSIGQIKKTVDVEIRGGIEDVLITGIPQCAQKLAALESSAVKKAPPQKPAATVKKEPEPQTVPPAPPPTPTPVSTPDPTPASTPALARARSLKGSLSIVTDSDFLELFVDGNNQGFGNKQIDNLKPGKYKVEGKKNGKTIREKEVTVRANKTTTVTLSVSKRKAIFLLSPSYDMAFTQGAILRPVHKGNGLNIGLKFNKHTIGMTFSYLRTPSQNNWNDRDNSGEYKNAEVIDTLYTRDHGLKISEFPYGTCIGSGFYWIIDIVNRNDIFSISTGLTGGFWYNGPSEYYLTIFDRSSGMELNSDPDEHGGDDFYFGGVLTVMKLGYKRVHLTTTYQLLFGMRENAPYNEYEDYFDRNPPAFGPDVEDVDYMKFALGSRIGMGITFTFGPLN